MNGWVKGIIASLLILLIGGICYSALVFYGPLQMTVALFVSIIAALGLLTLLSAIENNSTVKGALIPFIALFGVLLAYFGQAPFEVTVALCFFVSTFSAIVIQQD